jgi:hypothetical protein
MRIEKLVIPTPFPVGPINIYLIIDDPLTLVDTGPKTEEALSALREQLRKLGFIAADLRRIFLTHTHEDHCGLAGALQRESGARVYVHEWEFENISLHRQTRVNRDLLKRAGVPPEELEKMAGRYELIPYAGQLLSLSRKQSPHADRRHNPQNHHAQSDTQRGPDRSEPPLPFARRIPGLTCPHPFSRPNPAQNLSRR